MSKSLIPAQRRERIQEYLTLHKIARTVDLCNLLETSEATVRRDLEWLEQDGFLERTHGGAILNQRMVLEPEYRQKAQHHIEEKRRIGTLAAALIEKGDIVFLSSGKDMPTGFANINDKYGTVYGPPEMLTKEYVELKQRAADRGRGMVA